MPDTLDAARTSRAAGEAGWNRGVTFRWGEVPRTIAEVSRVYKPRRDAQKMRVSWGKSQVSARHSLQAAFEPVAVKYPSPGWQPEPPAVT